MLYCVLQNRMLPLLLHGGTTPQHFTIYTTLQPFFTDSSCVQLSYLPSWHRKHDGCLIVCMWVKTDSGGDIQLPTTVQWYDIDSLTTLLLSCLGKTNWANHLFFHLHYVIIFVGYFDDISLSYSCSHCVTCINERSQIALSLEFNISCKYMRPLSFCVGIFTALKLFKFNTKIKKSKQACCKVFALLLSIYKH